MSGGPCSRRRRLRGEFAAGQDSGPGCASSARPRAGGRWAALSGSRPPQPIWQNEAQSESNRPCPDGHLPVRPGRSCAGHRACRPRRCRCGREADQEEEGRQGVAASPPHDPVFASQGCDGYAGERRLLSTWQLVAPCLRRCDCGSCIGKPPAEVHRISAATCSGITGNSEGARSARAWRRGHFQAVIARAAPAFVGGCLGERARGCAGWRGGREYIRAAAGKAALALGAALAALSRARSGLRRPRREGDGSGPKPHLWSASGGEGVRRGCWAPSAGGPQARRAIVKTRLVRLSRGGIGAAPGRTCATSSATASSATGHPRSFSRQAVKRPTERRSSLAARMTGTSSA